MTQQISDLAEVDLTSISSGSALSMFICLHRLDSIGSTSMSMFSRDSWLLCFAHYSLLKLSV